MLNMFRVDVLPIFLSSVVVLFSPVIDTRMFFNFLKYLQVRPSFADIRVIKPGKIPLIGFCPFQVKVEEALLCWFTHPFLKLVWVFLVNRKRRH
jgi:hypothetical protein